MLRSILLLALLGLAAEPPAGAELKATPEKPLGWRGDWTGRFPAANPPTTWSRRVHGITTALRYQAGKPAGDPGKDSKPLEYFTIKDWLIAGPFAAQDPSNLDSDLLGGEAAVLPAEGKKDWRFLRADIDTQSRHDHNEGTCGQSYVDFVYAFGKVTMEGNNPKIEGDFTNKVAYAHTYLFSPAEAKVLLQVPFDGTAAKFWLNGKPTVLDPRNRSKPYDVSLAPGWNRLLVKVSAAEALGKHYSGRWLSRWMLAAYLTPVGPVSYESKNITWMTKLTGRSMSQPIVVGDRIFLGSSISDLMCISRVDGRVLWIRTTTPADAPGNSNPDAAPMLEKLAKHNEEIVVALNAAVSPQGLPSDKAAELDKKLKEKRELEQAIHKSYSQMDRKKYPPYFENEVSSSNATPVSDGARVYWVAGGGIKGPGAYGISCFDLDGKRLWTVHEVLGSLEHGDHASPTLVEGKLIYCANSTALALNSKTGETVWKNSKLGDVGSGTSPVVARLGNESVIVTLKQVLRVADGVAIGDHKLEIWGTLTPIVENGILYNTSRFRGWNEPEGVIAVRMPSTAVWDAPGKDLTMPLRGPNFAIASPLFVDGILYGVDMTGGMIAIDVASKQGLYRKWLDGYNRYNRYLYGVAASPTYAGKHIYVVDDAGYTHLIQPGPQFKEVGKNVLENLHFSGVGGNPCKQESFYTAPWFDGKAMYLRGEEYLYKIEEPGRKS
jgi:outer membrane protein assembly factor BamB